MGQREPDQPAFEVSQVQATFGGQLGEAWKTWLNRAWAEKAKAKGLDGAAALAALRAEIAKTKQ